MARSISADMLGQPRVFGACRGDTEQVDLNRILGVHRDVLLIPVTAEGDHRPSITGVSEMSPAISAASGVAMSHAVFGDVCVPPPSHPRDVLGGEFIIG
jgi:hypothetical protein